MQRCSLVVAGACFILVLSACTADTVVAPNNSPVEIEISQLFLTITNISDLPLTNVTIGVKPGGVRPE